MGNECPDCHWMQRCSGCVIPPPSEGDVLVSLGDGNTLAIDWHFVTYEEVGVFIT
jgi:hypothetical protein